MRLQYSRGTTQSCKPNILTLAPACAPAPVPDPAPAHESKPLGMSSSLLLSPPSEMSAPTTSCLTPSASTRSSCSQLLHSPPPFPIPSCPTSSTPPLLPSHDGRGDLVRINWSHFARDSHLDMPVDKVLAHCCYYTSWKCNLVSENTVRGLCLTPKFRN